MERYSHKYVGKEHIMVEEPEGVFVRWRDVEAENTRLRELNREMVEALEAADLALSCIRALKGDDMFKGAAEKVGNILAKAEGEVG